MNAKKVNQFVILGMLLLCVAGTALVSAIVVLRPVLQSFAWAVNSQDAGGNSLEVVRGNLPTPLVQEQAGSNPLPTQAEAAETGIPVTPTLAAPVTTPAEALLTPETWDGKTRVNVLILGVDSSDWKSPERLGPPRSDTMLVLTIDPVSKTAGMLSIPRDLWVDIPGMVKPNKINTAHRFGELYELPGGGPGLAMRTVEELLGVPIHYYVRLDFRAFERFIDEIGGVTVDVPARIRVDPIGPDNSVLLEPGEQMLDGAVALAYARNRNTARGDFDRAQRQQQVIFAVRDRILSADMLPTLILKAPALYESLSTGIQSNLTLGRAIKLAWLAREVKTEDIQSAFIGSSELIAGKSESGGTVYLPNPDRIRLLVADLFTSAGGLSTPYIELEERMQSEDPRISIVNASGVPDLGDRSAAYFESLGFQVTQVSTTTERTEKSRLIDYTRKVYTVKYLSSQMGIYPPQIKLESTPGSEVDVEIILGTEWAWSRPMRK